MWVLDDKTARHNAFKREFRRVACTTGCEQERLVASMESELEVAPLPSHCGVMLNWDQIRQMRDEGHVIGSHTQTHPSLAHIGINVVREELAHSKQRLQTELGIEIVHFSYPRPLQKPHRTAETVALSKDVGIALR